MSALAQDLPSAAACWYHFLKTTPKGRVPHKKVSKMKKWIHVLALAAILVAPLSACNTMEGLGRDTKAAGDALTGAAQENKGY